MVKPCSVFISSTSEDLRDYRVAARDAVLAAGLRPEMMEHFAARPRIFQIPPELAAAQI
jgi:hypothetical protein